MEPRSYQFVTPSGESRFAREWRPDETALGVIVLIHGLSDHIGRFDHLARFFAGEGFEVHGFDLQGNGMSPGKRGHFVSLEQVMDEMDSFVGSQKEHQQSLPCFLYGQSMGGNLVLNYGIRRNPRITGIIASSPWLRLAHPPGKTTNLIARWLGRLNPALSRPDGINSVDLSSDQAVSQSYASDPLVHGLITLGTFNLITAAGEFAISHADQLLKPTLIMHGTADRVTSAEASQEFVAASNGNSSFRLWPGLRHEIHNEPAKEEIFRYVLNWMKENFPHTLQPET